MKGSIRNRIILSHWLVVLIVLLILGPLCYWLLVAELKKQRFEYLDFLASHMSAMVESRLRSYSQRLSDLAQEQLIRSFPETARVPAVAELLARQRAIFSSMVLLDSRGWEEVRVIQGQNQNLGGSFENQRLFQQAQETPNVIVIRQPGRSLLSGEPIVPMIYGIRRYFGDEFIGALYGELRLARLTAFLGSIPVGRTGFILLVDSDRQLLYHPDNQRVLTPLPDSHDSGDWLLPALDGDRGVVEGRFLGIDALIGYAPVRSLNATLITVLPKEEFLEAPNKMKTAILGAMVALLMIAALVARWFAGRLARPVMQLTELARKIAEGTLPDSVAIDRTGDEIDQLADSFSKMLAELRNSMVSRHYLDRILASMREALLLVGLDGKIRTANCAACNLVGMPARELEGRKLESLFEVERIGTEPWLQVLLAQPGQRLTWQMLKTADGLRPVRLVWTVLADGSGHVREVACLFSPDPGDGPSRSDLGQGPH